MTEPSHFQVLSSVSFREGRFYGVCLFVCLFLCLFFFGECLGMYLFSPRKSPQFGLIRFSGGYSLPFLSFRSCKVVMSKRPQAIQICI